jgi:hypothetical protein
MIDEFWSNVPGYEGVYEVSTLGNFRRADTRRPVAVTFSPKNGYGYVHLSKGGIAQNYRAHRIVLQANVGLPSGTQDGRHLDGNKRNNRLDNLAWGTALENTDDKRRHGTLRGAHKGSAHHNAKLSEDAVEAIFNMRARGMQQKDIARFFGVSQSNISWVLNNKSWQSENATKRAEMRL